MKIVFIGAGNLATNLCIALKNAKFEIVQIYSRTQYSAQILAEKTNSDFTNRIINIYKNADLYISAIPDAVLEETVKKIGFTPSLLIHTSGSMPMDILKNYSNDFGVMYPIQTFTKNKILDFKTIPICIEGNNIETQTKLLNIAEKISEKIVILNSEQRLKIHLSAVFANNFTNHILAIAEDILHKENLDFDLLKPLIEETYKKVLEFSPSQVQTGPAARNDVKTISRHKEILSENPLSEKIYSFVSESILDFKNKDELGLKSK